MFEWLIRPINLDCQDDERRCRESPFSRAFQPSQLTLKISPRSKNMGRQVVLPNLRVTGGGGGYYQLQIFHQAAISSTHLDGVLKMLKAQTYYAKIIVTCNRYSLGLAQLQHPYWTVKSVQQCCPHSSSRGFLQMEVLALQPPNSLASKAQAPPLLASQLLFHAFIF